MMAELGQLIVSSSARGRGPSDTGHAKRGRRVSGAEFGLAENRAHEGDRQLLRWSWVAPILCPQLHREHSLTGPYVSQ